MENQAKKTPRIQKKRGAISLPYQQAVIKGNGTL
jgi:hypothetical protein